MHQPPRGKVRAVLVVVAVVAAVIVGSVVYSYFFGPDDPVYNGRKLSSHLRRAFPFPMRNGAPAQAKWPKIRSQEYQTARDETIEAIQALGPRSVPLIREWFNTRESWSSSHIRDLAFKYDLPFPSFFQNRALMATWAIRHAPGDFEPLIPDLCYRVNSGNTGERYTASVLLREILHARELTVKRPWPEAYASVVPALLEGCREDANSAYLYAELAKLILENSHLPDYKTRDRIVRSILWTRGGAGLRGQEFYKMAAAVDPQGEIRSAMLNGTDPQGKVAAALSYKAHEKPIEEIVPTLLEGAGSTNEFLRKGALDQLGVYGNRVRFAVPALSNLMQNAESRIVEEFRQAIWKIQIDESRQLQSK